MAKVMILNGPNLNTLGTREPEIYGTLSLADIESACAAKAGELEMTIDFRQSNSEADLVNWMQEAAKDQLPVIINPAAFTHTSVALRDAASLLTKPLIEVHISNPLAREEFRHTSFISGIAKGTIAGFGVNSYLLALDALNELI